MKILVIGANGRVGSLLVTKLAAQHQVLAGSRNPDSPNNADNIEQVYMDLLSDVDTLAESMNGVDAIYFVSGSRGKNLLQIDLHGAIKTMQAAEKAGVKRYIMLSSVFALRPERWNESFLSDLADYNIAKHYADLYLTTQTQLDYTILQPGALKEEQGTGKIETQVTNPGSNSIANVVDTLVAVLENNSTIGKVILMHDGDTPIAEALDEIL
ncbi:SDR family oxidoreductase [Chryseobacterium vrystaatense]|uniref:NAD-dependent dehydratase n=1 Tax=Chryseobacterium vrystaatense TaxID=307480 RepID=A0ABR4UIC7_9FLAO|nr:SDR family oxidoreductase [Chryseobacterium vrystaatense]KFF24436.1 NAD-dependent dehydratase [Chryseobacterium vrystaatense]